MLLILPPAIRSVGLLAALFVISALTGCHPGLGGLDGCPVEGCGTRTEVNLGGTLSGLVDSGLVLQNTLQNNPAETLDLMAHPGTALRRSTRQLSIQLIA